MRIAVRSRVPGAERWPDVSVEVALRATARQLIRAAVAEQIRAWAADEAERRVRLDQQFMTDDEIRAAAAAGVVKMPRRAAEARRPEAEAEADRAVRAFTRGVFALFVGGTQIEDLDAPLTFRLDEPVVFLRLTPLVGG